MPMRPESKLLGQALLDHHRARIKAAPPAPPGKRLLHARYTIPYSSLCAQAGRPDLTRIVGGFLGEVAAWCAELGYPPLTSMAVNAQTGAPGQGYDGTGGFDMNAWVKNLEDCIRFAGYPEKMS